MLFAFNNLSWSMLLCLFTNFPNSLFRVFLIHQFFSESFVLVTIALFSATKLVKMDIAVVRRQNVHSAWSESWECLSPTHQF